MKGPEAAGRKSILLIAIMLVQNQMYIIKGRASVSSESVERSKGVEKVSFTINNLMLEFEIHVVDEDVPILQ